MRSSRFGWLLAVAFVAAACSVDASPASCSLPGIPASACPIPAAERQAAPSDSVPLVGGGEASLADFAGRVVVLNFWASWCGPCRAEQPVLNAAREALPTEDVAFVGVNLQDSEPNAQAHVDEFDVSYPSFADPSSALAARFGGVGPRSIPTTIIIDRAGRVAARLFGEVSDPLQVVVLASAVLEE